VLVFFSFSTTQEYYSLPTYPAFALLLGCAINTGGVWIRRGTKAVVAVASVAAAVIAVILWHVWALPTPGDISTALVQHPEMYTLSLGHMGDLTLQSFAYLPLPLALAGVAALTGVAGIVLGRNRKNIAFYAVALMMV